MSVFIDGFGLSWQYRPLGTIWIARLSELTKSHKMARLVLDRFVVWRQVMQTGSKPFIPGPYKLLGWSFGGDVAHELAIELRRRGCVVQRLVLLDAAFSANKVIARLSANKVIARLSANKVFARLCARNLALGENQIVEHILRSNSIDTPEQSGPLTYRQAEELIQQREAVEFAIPPRADLWSSWFKVLMPTSGISWNTRLICLMVTWSYSPLREVAMRTVPHLKRWRRYVAGDISSVLGRVHTS